MDNKPCLERRLCVVFYLGQRLQDSSFLFIDSFHNCHYAANFFLQMGYYDIEHGGYNCIALSVCVTDIILLSTCYITASLLTKFLSLNFICTTLSFCAPADQFHFHFLLSSFHEDRSFICTILSFFGPEYQFHFSLSALK